MISNDEWLECAFLIPLVRNSDRRPHRPLCWNALVDALYDEFGGDTGPELIYRAIRPTPGEYRDDASVRIADESWRYLVAVPRQRLDALRRIRSTRSHSILSVAGIVEFVRGTADDGFLE